MTSSVNPSDRCNACGGLGHWARECPSNSRGMGRGMGGPPRFMGGGGMDPRMHDDMMGPKCFECGQRGHVAREVRVMSVAAVPLLLLAGYGG